MTGKIDPEVNWEDPKEYENCYAPSSDTFFLCDGIKAAINEIPENPFVLEIGSGSGYVTAFFNRLLKSLGKVSIHFTTDINPICCQKTLSLCNNNGVLVSPIRDYFCSHLRGPFDVVIFNPPYVETSSEELKDAIEKGGIEASYAGGEDGAEVIYDFLNFIVQNPSKFSNNLRIFLLLSVVNHPLRIKRFCKQNGLEYNKIISKNCEGESLIISCIKRINSI